ncbi:MAG TPA: hypothetical protein VIU61_21175, partial [Kofleriaceae bacterium]
NLGAARYHAGQHAAALAHFERAELTWRDVNAKHPVMADVLVGRYRAQRALGKKADVAELERALELAKGLSPFQRAKTEVTLGAALTGPRSIQLVESSVKDYAECTLPLCQQELAAAKAWLTERSGGRASR